MDQKSFNLPFDKFQEKINTEFKEYKYPKIEIKDNCNSIKNDKFELSLTQQFIGEYFTRDNPNGLLLYHSVGAGKTLTAINILYHLSLKSSSFVPFNTLWVTRTTLKKDLDKALIILPLPKPLFTISYKQFSNICKRRGENYRKLLDKARLINPKTNDPFYNTCIIIDEAHKLYGQDLKAQEMHDIKAIEKTIYESYSISKENRARVVLMSATPLNILNLLNLIITKEQDRFNIPEMEGLIVNDAVNDKFNLKLEMKGKKKVFKFLFKKGIEKDYTEIFKEKSKGLISYIDKSKSPAEFAQVNFIDVKVPISSPVILGNTRITQEYCNDEYTECNKLSFIYNKKECSDIKKKCIEKAIKQKVVDSTGKKKFQTILLKKKCNIDLSN